MFVLVGVQLKLWFEAARVLANVSWKTAGHWCVLL